MWPLLLGFVSVYLFSRSLYRLYLHPLSKIPGPKIAAITWGYEFYHDVLRHGMYIWEIEKMHKRYGPVVRISPGQLHINDPHFYDDVYAPASRKREKDPASVTAFGTPYSMLTTVGHDQHRYRRGLLNSYFSKKSVLELSPILQEKISILMQRFEKASQDSTVLHLDDAFSALTGDIISEYVWGVSGGFLEDENFKNEVRQAVTEMTDLIHFSKFFPILATIFRVMPRWLVAKLRPGATAVLDMQDLITERHNTQKDGTNMDKKTIFEALTDPSVRPEERSPPRLADEGMILMVGGTETTARVLSMAAFTIYQDEHLLEKLREELRPVMPTPTSKASWSELEQLPFLNGVVHEALRLGDAATLRSPRVAPIESLQYKDLVIPPGSPISMSPYSVLRNPETFPEPESFQPERWIQAAQKGQNLSKYLVAFSRGSRNCLGMNLAYAELYMTIAALIRRFDLEIFETSAESIRPGRDLGMAQPKEGRFAVRAKTTNVIKE